MSVIWFHRFKKNRLLGEVLDMHWGMVDSRVVDMTVADEKGGLFG